MSENVPGDEPVVPGEPQPEQRALPVVPGAPSYAAPPPGTPMSQASASALPPAPVGTASAPGAAYGAPVYAAPAYGPPAYGPPMYGPAAYGAPVYARAPQSQGLAIASLVIGICVAILMFVPLLFWITFPAALTGLALGIVALSRGQSRGMAVTGVVLNALVSVFAIVALMLLALGFGFLFWLADEWSRYYG